MQLLNSRMVMSTFLQGMDEVIASDGQSVTVAGHDPHIEGSRTGDAASPVAIAGARPWMECSP